MKYLLASIFVLNSIFGLAQKQKSTQQQSQQSQEQTASQNNQPQNSLTQHFIRKYALAAQWNDYSVAKDALYDLIIENPDNDSLLITLAYYYYENREYAPTLLVSQELLARSPKNINFLQLSAEAGEALGVNDKALQNYETIYLLTNNTGTLYKIAFLQFDMKRFNESLTNADILLGKPEIVTEKVYFNDAENKPKEYVMKVAILNLKGLILQEKGDKTGAKKLFEEALALAPDFVLAKQNLAKVK